jgi:hypothetical protein
MLEEEILHYLKHISYFITSFMDICGVFTSLGKEFQSFIL